jgi:membrane-bound inhibitor of C-type lysozyme
MHTLSALAVLSLAALSLAACASPCPAPLSEPTTSNFACDDGSTMRVTFTHGPERALVEQEGYIALNLPARIVGSGFRYSDGAAELKGRTSEAHWARPGAAETVCREVQSPAPTAGR